MKAFMYWTKANIMLKRKASALKLRRRRPPTPSEVAFSHSSIGSTALRAVGASEAGYSSFALGLTNKDRTIASLGHRSIRSFRRSASDAPMVNFSLQDYDNLVQPIQRRIDRPASLIDCVQSKNTVLLFNLENFMQVIP